MQLIAWPLSFVQALVEAGYRVSRHDNRDVGLSQHFDELGVPNLVWALTQARFGFTPQAPYRLAGMGHDLAPGVLPLLLAPLLEHLAAVSAAPSGAVPA